MDFGNMPILAHANTLADVCIIALYALGSIGGILGLSPRRQRLRAPAAWCTAAGFALHTLAMFLLLALTDLDELSKRDLLRLMAWSLIMVYCVAWWRLRFALLGLTAAPLALVFYIAAAGAADVQGAIPEELSRAFFLLHLGVLSVYLALVTLGFGASIFFLNLHRKLKSKIMFSDADSKVPALATVDRVNHWVVMVGFPLYTIGLVSGFAWARTAWGRTLSWDPKEVVSLLIWLFFALIFHQRIALGWQGKRMAVMLICLFIVTVASMLGVNFLMDSHHNLFQSAALR